MRENSGKPDWVRTHEAQEADFFSYETIRGRKAYLRFLGAFQSGTDLFPHSRNPINRDLVGITPDEVKRRYDAALLGYQYSPRLTDRCDYADRGPVVAHKLHLNVSISGVREVARYLQEKKYHHKFGTGGDFEDGRTFTLFIGSHQLAFAMARELSDELGVLLSRPLAKDEVEYAPNVVGRFSTALAKYSKYGLGIRGISCLNRLGSSLDFQAGSPQRLAWLQGAFMGSYAELSDDYGEYFHG